MYWLLLKKKRKMGALKKVAQFPLEIKAITIDTYTKRDILLVVTKKGIGNRYFTF